MGGGWEVGGRIRWLGFGGIETVIVGALVGGSNDDCGYMSAREW